MSASPTPQVNPSLAARLRSIHVGLREDLEVTRHLFRGQPSYVVRDPLTFQSQRLDHSDYEVFTSIQSGRTLSDIFDDLVRRGRIGKDNEEQFYQFVFSLHRLGFLRLPISDDKLLYRRYQMREQARRREKLLGFLFLRIPLWNPDAFLSRTIHLVRPLFSRFFFIFWILVVGSAGYVAARNWNDLIQPIHGVLAAQNLLLMWVTLIVLKFFHELGHTYACKHFGGHVPEMGAYLIIFTPCAYMDASASWGFTRKSERLFVCLAGMYIEAMIAAVAVLVWAVTDTSLLNAVAYNVIFLASVVTVLFNINPLLRYDGYYIASDLVEIPNLRQRSSRYVLGVLKRLLLGISGPPEPGGLRLRSILFVYGIAATMYRTSLVIAIAAILAAKTFILGIALGVLFLGGIVFSIVRKLTAYLWYAEETAQKRWRAVALSLLVVIGLPAGLVFIPLPAHVEAAALITAEHETVVRAKTPGFLEEAHVEYGRHIGAGEPLASLSNDYVLEELEQARANLAASEIRQDAYRVGEPARALQEESRIRVFRQALEEAQGRQADLDVTAPCAGLLTESVRDSDIGSFLAEGNPVAVIVAGGLQARAILTEDQIARSEPRVGDRVAFRSAGASSQTIEGIIAKIAPAGSRTIGFQALTHLGGGDIPVDPATHNAAQPYFVVTIDLPEEGSTHMRHYMTGYVRLGAQAEPLAKSLGRRLIRFWNRLLQGQ